VLVSSITYSRYNRLNDGTPSDSFGDQDQLLQEDEPDRGRKEAIDGFASSCAHSPLLHMLPGDGKGVFQGKRVSARGKGD